jgi:SAM-dependent methyltransferase
MQRNDAPCDLLPKVALHPHSSHLLDYPGLLPAPFAEVMVMDLPGADALANRIRGLGRKAVMVPASEPVAGRLYDVHPNLLRIPGRGRALDLGCGAGRDALWLAANGWDVVAVDRLAPPTYPAEFSFGVDWVQSNLFDLPEIEPVDLVLLHYAWDAQYVGIAADLVKPGGYLSLAAHSPLHFRCFGHPRPARIFDVSVLPTAFETVFCEAFWSNDRHSVNTLFKKIEDLC